MWIFIPLLGALVLVLGYFTHHVNAQNPYTTTNDTREKSANIFSYTSLVANYVKAHPTESNVQIDSSKIAKTSNFTALYNYTTYIYSYSENYNEYVYQLTFIKPLTEVGKINAEISEYILQTSIPHNTKTQWNIPLVYAGCGQVSSLNAYLKPIANNQTYLQNIYKQACNKASIQAPYVILSKINLN